MTRTEALKHLRVMFFAVQKARSSLLEAVGDDQIGQGINADLAPWLFGPRSVLPALVKYLDRIEAGAHQLGGLLQLHGHRRPHPGHRRVRHSQRGRPA